MPYHRVTFKSLRKKNFDFEPTTLGDHIKKKRLMLGLTLKEAGARNGVTEFTIINWESGSRTPLNTSMPAIIEFLGYDPYPPAPKTIAARLLAKRRELGWAQKVAARKLGVDPATWSSWECGGTIMAVVHRKLVARFLGLAEADLNAAMRKRWNEVHGKPTR